MLRYYQDNARNAVHFALSEFDRVLLQLPTGAGKTVVAAHLIQDFQPARCLFLADQDELCAQPLTVLEREAHIIAAIHKAHKKPSLAAKVIVGSSQTLERKKNLEYYPPKFFDYAIVDEAHRGADRDQKITDHLAKKVIGITATPFKANLRDLSKYYEEVAYALPMLDLIDDGFAPKLKVLTIPVEIDLAEVKTKRGFDGKDYDAESLSTTIAPYYIKIIELLREHAQNRHTIVFLPLISSSIAFAQLARDAGIQAIHVDGKSEDRAEILEAFRRGRYQMLCNSQVVATGVDLPVADCFVNLCPTRSAVSYQQRVGRVLRVLPNVIDDIPEKCNAAERRKRIAQSSKPDALIIDFLWQHDELGIMRPGHLVATNEEDAKSIFERVKEQRTPEDLQRIAKWVQEEKEGAVVKRLEEVAARSGGGIEPAGFGFLINRKDFISYEPTSRWEMKPPTENQIRALQRWGIDTATVKSIGLASKLMDEMIHRSEYGLAHFRQLRALASMNVKYDARTLTAKQALTLISEAKLTAARSSSIKSKSEKING